MSNLTTNGEAKLGFLGKIQQDQSRAQIAQRYVSPSGKLNTDPEEKAIPRKGKPHINSNGFNWNPNPDSPVDELPQQAFGLMGYIIPWFGAKQWGENVPTSEVKEGEKKRTPPPICSTVGVEIDGDKIIRQYPLSVPVNMFLTEYQKENTPAGFFNDYHLMGSRGKYCAECIMSGGHKDGKGCGATARLVFIVTDIAFARKPSPANPRPVLNWQSVKDYKTITEVEKVDSNGQVMTGKDGEVLYEKVEKNLFDGPFVPIIMDLPSTVLYTRKANPLEINVAKEEDGLNVRPGECPASLPQRPTLPLVDFLKYLIDKGSPYCITPDNREEIPGGLSTLYPYKTAMFCANLSKALTTEKGEPIAVKSQPMFTFATSDPEDSLDGDAYMAALEYYNSVVNEWKVANNYTDPTDFPVYIKSNPTGKSDVEVQAVEVLAPQEGNTTSQEPFNVFNIPM